MQWVPHGYGRRAMNLTFCFWLWKRAFRGDRIELMVHEPFLAFWEGNWRQTAVAVVHRFMTLILLQAAGQVWVSIPAWERMWKPYALGRSIPFVWLPIPSSLGAADPNAVGATRNIRRRDHMRGRPSRNLWLARHAPSLCSASRNSEPPQCS